MPKSRPTIEQFVKERNKALLSLDESKIRTMYRKFNGTELPTDLLVFWRVIHIAITGVKNGPLLNFVGQARLG
jgi:hypothetical protein